MSYWIWLIFAVAFVVVEFCTVQLVSIWMAVGALLTCIITAIFPSLPPVGQIFIFFALSAVALGLTRPLCKKFLKRKKEQQTNLDRLIDELAIVTERIDNISGGGAIKLQGQVWSAKSIDGESIEVGEIVIFKEIQGNKALVIKKEK